MKNVSNTALITGVSSGIGLAITDRLIQEGWYVIGTLRNKTKAEELTQKYTENNFSPILVDLTIEDEINQLSDKVQEILKDQPLNLLINNAGLAAFGPMEYFPIAEFRKLMEINTVALLSVTQIALPFLKRDKSKARIINISSGAGKMVRPYLGTYAATKHAVEAISDAFRRELAMNYGIKTVVIQAGPIKTSIWEKSKDKPNTYQDTEYSEIMSKVNEFVKDAEKLALPVEKLSDLVLKIIQTKNPKPRYLIAPKKPMFYLAMYVLPDRMLDKIFKKQINKYLTK